jgi:thiol:disulfide interchange protein
MLEIAGWLFLSLIAGILLNATPCVLPAVPIKLRILLNEGGQSPRRRALTGAALLAGSLAFFASLGALSIVLQWPWGAAMGSPVFRGILAATLALAGVLMIVNLGHLPIPQRIATWQGRGPTEGFVVGVTGGILSLPCTGPFLGGVLAFSLGQSPAVSMALFVAIGAGMALPYLILLAVPRWAPKSGLGGRFGRVINRLLGFGLIAGALFYAQGFLPGWLQGQASVLLMAGLLALWALIAWRRRAPRLETGLAGFATLALALAINLIPATSANMPGASASADANETDTLQWQPITRAEAHPRNVQGPALIEFTADWCINCKVLERTVYAEPEVATASRDMATMQLDLTDFDRDAQTLLQAWGGTGLPYAVVVDASGEVQAKLRDLFTTETLVTALDQVSSQQ